jgi:hypothetical protein
MTVRADGSLSRVARAPLAVPGETIGIQTGGAIEREPRTTPPRLE